MDLRETLKPVYLFRGATDDDLEALAAIAAAEHFPNAARLFDSGHEADSFFVVTVGTVELRAAGKDMAFATRGTGQTFGELPFFRSHLRQASALTRESTHVVRIPYAALERVLAERPALALLFYRNAAAYFAQHLHLLGSERDTPYL